jgi:hypothetical protein
LKISESSDRVTINTEAMIDLPNESDAVESSTNLGPNNGSIHWEAGQCKYFHCIRKSISPMMLHPQTNASEFIAIGNL